MGLRAWMRSFSRRGEGKEVDVVMVVGIELSIDR